jgi:enamine deaminase RidA (YjgF/YER057c/UK114 family)
MVTNAMATNLRELYEIYPAEPRAAMPIGIRVDDWLYGSVSGVDPLTRRFSGDMLTQMPVAVAALKHVLASGGMQPRDIHGIRVYRQREDPRYFAALQALLSATSDREALGARLQVYDDPQHLAPAQHIRVDFTASLGETDLTAKILTPGVKTAPDAVQIGPVLWTPMVTAADPDSGATPDDIEAQVVAAFDNLERLLVRAGVGQDQVLRIAGYIRDLKDKDLLNDAMMQRFPVWAEKPVHKYVPAALPEGVEFALQAMAVDDAPRRIIEIEGIKHNDPISLGAQVGNVFVSSRVQARLEPTAREQASRLIDSHARRLVEHIGGSLDDVTQLVWGIGDPAFETEVREECARHWRPDRLPRIHVMQADFPHSPLPRLEFIALV